MKYILILAVLYLTGCQSMTNLNSSDPSVTQERIHEIDLIDHN